MSEKFAYITGNVLRWIEEHYAPDETAMAELCSILEEAEA